MYDLSTFRLERVLNNNTKSKTISLLGTFASNQQQQQHQQNPELHTEEQQSQESIAGGGVGGGDQPAIVVLEKTAFTDDDVNTNEHCVVRIDDHSNGGANEKGLQRRYFSIDTKLKQEFINDIYGNFLCYPQPAINSVKLTIICPCTEKHIQKYSTQAIRIVYETPDLFKSITEPRLQLESEQFTLDWVYNILDHKKESERIIFEDPCKTLGFILLPDLKWDGKTVETFYAIAIVHQLNLKSLRSLRAEHLPLLRNIQRKAVRAIHDKYGLDESQLRIYLHYQPSFYHLHVHFTYLKHDAPGIHCERSHMLSTVINNIELVADYYQRATIPFVIKETDPYYGKYCQSTDEDSNIDDTNTSDTDADTEIVAKKPKISGGD